MSQFTTDRRTIVKGAAWAVPAVSVAAAAPTLAASNLTYQTVTKDLVYPALGLDIAVRVTASNVPQDVHADEALDPIQVNSTVTLPSGVASAVRSLFLNNAHSVGGTSKSTSEMTGAYTSQTTTDLTIPITPFPASGDLALVATGTGTPTTIAAGTSPGTVTITMGKPESILNGYNENGTPNGRTYNSRLEKKAGEDYTLTTFTIH